MNKCRGCGKFLSSSLAAACGHCSAVYHRACVALPDDIKLNPGWVCPECKSKLPKGNNSATPVKSIHAVGETVVAATPATQNVLIESHALATVPNPIQLSSVDLGLEMRLFREEMSKVRQEFKDFRQEIAGLSSMIANCNSRMDQFENRLTELEERSKESSIAKVSALEQTISQFKQELYDRDQDLLQADIDISNLPENKGENPAHTVTVLAAKLGLTLNKEDIVFAERVGKLTETIDGAIEKRNRRLVVRLSRHHLRDELLRAARVRRNINSADISMESPARRFYLNERLTPANRRLFYLVRESARQLQWKYTWTRRGRIYARQSDGKRAHWIRTEEDRVRVFGSVDVSETKA